MGELAEGVASAILEYDEPALCIVRMHKKPYQDMRKAIEKALGRLELTTGKKAPEVHFLTWGRHLAINTFADIKHVILVGIMQYSAMQAEAAARAAAALAPDDNATLSDHDFKQFHLGEVAHHLFQATGRGAFRKCTAEGDVPAGTTLDVIFSTKANRHLTVPSGILSHTFPRAHIENWEPLPPTLTTKQQRLVQTLRERASEEGIEVTLKELSEAAGISDVSNVGTMLKKRAVKAALARASIMLERRQGKPMIVRDLSRVALERGLVGRRDGPMKLARPKRRLRRTRRPRVVARRPGLNKAVAAPPCRITS